MASAIQFHDWSFLQDNYKEDVNEKTEWMREKRQAEVEMSRRIWSKSAQKEMTEIFALSREFPMLEEKALPSFKINVVRAGKQRPE